jgi:hypothetical protein
MAFCVFTGMGSQVPTQYYPAYSSLSMAAMAAAQQSAIQGQVCDKVECSFLHSLCFSALFLIPRGGRPLFCAFLSLERSIVAMLLQKATIFFAIGHSATLCRD